MQNVTNIVNDLPLEFVISHVKNIHSNMQDFEDGDILQRLERFKVYKAGTIPISILNLSQFAICEELVTDYMKMYQKNQNYPPIVYDAVDESIIDGAHRANALFRCGLKDINCLIGLEQNLNPEWEINNTEEENIIHKSEETLRTKNRL